MTRLSVTEARNELAEALNRVAYGGDRIVVHRRGKDLGAVISMADFELLEEIERHADLAAARIALAEVKKKGTVSWSNLKAELGL